ncbi:MAG: 4Fe-4S dicluster domain-containing protein [Desulfurispora sp.]|uniref:4Fe-4S dicluster domain-containing protein n=1 Tax=Desulfurispora sp. TaxID=3014275 RepID=UPI00404A5E8E
MGFLEDVRTRSKQPVELCFQCQKCASGCSIAEHADLYPNQVLRLIQLEDQDRVFNSSMIWMCTGCETCGARCPNGIKISEIMDALKEMAIERGTIKEKKIHLFNDIFLHTVKNHGRIHEAVMMANYKIKSGDLFSDMDLGWKMFLKGKLPVFCRGVRAKDEVKHIFDRCNAG